MRVQRIAIGLSALNLLLLVYLVGQTISPAEAQSISLAPDTEVQPMLRTRGLEIVDEQGRVRALLGVMPAERVDGKDYPETVLLRLLDPKSGPVVKLTASSNGSALLLSDDADGGFRVMARDTGNTLDVVNRDGSPRRIEPK